jgi:nitrogen fixation NifU-like protein
MDDLYREMILDHAQHRRNWGALVPCDFDHEETNPLCGDHLRLTLRLNDAGLITAVGWEGSGCAISQASASMLGEKLLGMPFAEARRLDRQEILDMIGIPLTINRVKCATLPLKTLVVGALGKATWERLEDGE